MFSMLGHDGVNWTQIQGGLIESSKSETSTTLQGTKNNHTRIQTTAKELVWKPD